jgi:hypothetical protein
MARPLATEYIIHRESNEDRTVGSLGGQVARYTAGSTLLVGDAVYLSGVNTVDKSTTAANYVGFVGFVVSGDALGDSQACGEYPVGTTAATVNQQVLVQISGIVAAIVGATGFVAGTNFNAVPSAATAGRVIPGTTADQRLGVVLTTQSTAGAAVRILIAHF